MTIHHKTLFCLFVLTLFIYETGSSQEPQLFVQTGHNHFINAVAFSPDAKLIASGSEDGTVRLWGTDTGYELRVLTGHTAEVTSIAFNNDGLLLATAAGDGTIKLWNVVSGLESKALKNQPGKIRSIAFSPDGNTLASGGDAVKLWDVDTGRELRTINEHFYAHSIAFDPNGKLLAAGNGFMGPDGANNVITLWDVSTGQQGLTLKGHTAGITSIAFSYDGKVLASGSADSTVRFWDINTGRELRVLEGHPNGVSAIASSPKTRVLASGGSLSDENILLWDITTGGLLRTLRGHHVEGSAVVYSAEALAISGDGSLLASGARDEKIKVWDIATGRELRTLTGRSAFSNWIDSVAISKDSKILAIGGAGLIKLRNVANGQYLRTFTGPSDLISLSSDSKTLTGRSCCVDYHSWDVATGLDLRALKGHPDRVQAARISDEGGSMPSESDDPVVRMWDEVTNQAIRTLKGESYQSNAISFSHDGKLLASGSTSGAVKLWQASTGLMLRQFEWEYTDVTSIAFSSDDKVIAAGSRSGGITFWTVATGQQLATVTSGSGSVDYLSFSPDDKLLVSVDSAGTVKIWDAATRSELHTLKHSSKPVISFSSDSKFIAITDNNVNVRLWDVAAGQVTQTFVGHSYFVTSITFTADSRILISGSADKTVKFWDRVSGKELASLIELENGDWSVVAPDGLFDGSPGGWSQIVWRFNNNTFNVSPVEAFFNEFYYPDLLSDLLNGKRPAASRDISQKDRRQPALELTAINPQSEVVALDVPYAERRIKLRLAVKDAPVDAQSPLRGSGAQDVRLFRNGSLVKVWRGDILKGKSAVTLEATVPIVAGENRLTAYAFNRDNIKSSDATLVVTGADSLKRSGIAYVLAVGVNTYSNTNYNLKYAVADAEDFSAEIKRQQEILKNYSRVEIIPLNDKEATKANVLQALSQLASKAQPEDAVIVYFSGHGTAAEQRFYLILHDLGYQGPRTKLSAADLKSILEHSISDRELEAAFEKIDAGQLLMVIDACNSGQALDSDEKRRGPMNSKGLAQLAYEKGMYILTAAQSYQAAWEASRLGHGYLTYALIEEGLKQGKADREPKDNQIVLREWLDYATEQVPRLQEEKMKETPQLKDQQGRELEFVFVEGDESIKDPAKRSVQRPRVFYRRELEAQPLVVGKTGPPK